MRASVRYNPNPTLSDVCYPRQEERPAYLRLRHALAHSPRPVDLETRNTGSALSGSQALKIGLSIGSTATAEKVRARNRPARFFRTLYEKMVPPRHRRAHLVGAGRHHCKVRSYSI
jgi:hypothetical protein